MSRLFQALYDIGCAILVTLPLFLIAGLVAFFLIAACAPVGASPDITFTVSNTTGSGTDNNVPSTILHFTDTTSFPHTSRQWMHVGDTRDYYNGTVMNTTFSTATAPTWAMGQGNWSFRLYVYNATTGWRVSDAYWFNTSYGLPRPGLTADGYRWLPRDHVYNWNISQASVLPNSSTFIANMLKPTADFYLAGEYVEVVDNNVSMLKFVKTEYTTLLKYNFTNGFQFVDYGRYMHYTDPSRPNYDKSMRSINIDNGTFFWAYYAGLLKQLNGTYRVNVYSSQDSSDYFLGSIKGYRQFPPLVMRNESLAGPITHAVGAAVAWEQSGNPWWPQWSDAGNCWTAYSQNPNVPPPGARMRLKSSFDTSGYSGAKLNFLLGLKNYGIILHDNSESTMLKSYIYIERPDEPLDTQWDLNITTFIGKLDPDDFEFIDESSLMIHRNSGKVSYTDTTPPLKIDSITNDTPTTTSVNISWDVPQDKFLDFDNVKVYANDTLKSTVYYKYMLYEDAMAYDITGLSMGQVYNIAVRSCDYAGNCNATYTNKTIYMAGCGGAAPVGAFTANATSGAQPLAIQFTDQSTNTPTDWLWSFGDGGSSTEQNPVHTYMDEGTFTVALDAGNAFGYGNEVKVNYITVTNPYERELLPTQMGYVSRTRANNSWSELLALPGNETTTNYTTARIQISGAAAPADNFTLNRWIFLTYNMSLLNLPVDSVITAAEIAAYSTADSSTGFDDWQVMLVDTNQSVPAVNANYGDFVVDMISANQTDDVVTVPGYHNFTITANASIPKTGYYTIGIMTSQQVDGAINWSASGNQNYWIDTAAYTPNMTLTWAPYAPPDNILLLIINYIKQFLHLGARLIT